MVGYHMSDLRPDARGVWAPPGLPGVEVALLRIGNPLLDTVTSALERAGWDAADLYLHYAPEYKALPADALTAGPPVALAVGDWNVAGRALHLLAPVTDVALCDPRGVPVLRRIGFPAVREARLWGWDPVAWTPGDPRADRPYDVVFAGSRNPAIHRERERFLLRLGRLGARHDVRIRTAFGEEYRQLFARAKLVFNYSVRGEANMRAFEAAVSGACVLNERGNVTLPGELRPDRDYATWDGDDLEQVIEALLADDVRRIAIAEAGRRAALPHTYAERVAGLLHAAFDSLGPRRPAVDPRHAARVLAEQWRLSTDPDAWPASDHLLALHEAPGPHRLRHEALSPLSAGPPVEGTAPPPGVSARAACAWTGGDETAPVALARAEAAVREGAANEAVLHASRALALPLGDDLRLPTPDYGEWRLALETAVLDAPDADRLAAACAHWLRLRAAWLLVESSGRALDPADAAALLDLPGPVRVPPPALFTRALARTRAADLAGAEADLEALVDLVPGDPAPRLALARLLALAGRTAEAARPLVALLDALAGEPDRAALGSALAEEAEALLRARPVTAAWSPNLPGGAGPLVAARAAGLVPGARLEIRCPDDAALERAAAGIGEAIRERGLDPAAVPDTDVLVDPRGIAGAALVIAPRGSLAREQALSAGLPVLDPDDLYGDGDGRRRRARNSAIQAAQRSPIQTGVSST